jgi:GR25 family glycosyltransferase involved in LPS biosynthesis
MKKFSAFLEDRAPAETQPAGRSASASAAPDYPAIVINLDEATTRLANMRAWYEPLDVKLSRFAGVPGDAVSAAVRARLLTGRQNPKAGSLGCYVSHLNVWEAVAQGDDENVLVVEDDAQPIRPFPRRFSELRIPADYDLCYVSRRMTPQCFREHKEPARVMSLFEALSARAPDQRGLGADGHFVSKRGAQRLLEVFGQDRLIQHFDIQTIASALSAGEAESLAGRGPIFATINRCRQRRRSTTDIRSFVLVPPLVKQNDQGVSFRLLIGGPDDSSRSR